ncbi:MAG: hypothetical protein V3V06_01605 [Dehalococcoidia bacterium]
MSANDESGRQTRGERREEKKRKKKRALRMHGASLRRIYRDAVLKRLRRQKGDRETSGSP